MKLSHPLRWVLIFVCAAFAPWSAPAGNDADDTNTPRRLLILSKPDTPQPRIVVFMPEKINTVWSWYYFTENQDHVVQTIVEKAMFDMGYDVIDLATVTLFQEPGTIEQVLDPRTAVQLAQQLGAEYVIVGHATAMQATDAQPRPGGRLDRIRSEATAVARVIRVSDGKVVAIEEAQSTGSAQTRQNLADGALREAAQRLSAKLAADLNLINLP